MAVLELLPGAAPARLVAPELLVLVQAPGLDVHRLAHLVGGVPRRRRDPGRHGTGRRSGERARLVLRAAARVAEPARGAGAGGGGPLLAGSVLALDLDLDAEDVAAELLPDRVDEPGEHLEALVLVGHERILLREAAQVDALAQVVHVVQVLAPALVDDLEQDEALELAHQLGPEVLLAVVVGLGDVVAELADQPLAVERVDVEVLDVDRRVVDLLELAPQALEVPVLHVVADQVLVAEALDRVADLVARRLRHVLALENPIANRVDDLALLVHHVVVLEDALADQEVLLLDLLLGVLDLLREHPGLDGLLLALLVDGAEPVEDAVDAVAREEAHQVVLGAQVETRFARVALPA